MTVRRVEHERIDLRVGERARPLERVGTDTDGRGDAQPAARVLRRQRVIRALLDVLDGDQSREPTVRVDDRQLLDLVPAQDLLGLVQRRSRRCRDEVTRSHQRGDGP
jgi:hypothetical protein